MPISLIEGEVEKKITINLENVNLKIVLDEIIAQAPEYQYRAVLDHLVFYHKLPKYEFIMKDVNLKGKSRYYSTYEYVSQLNRAYPEFSNLIPPGILGDLRHPVYSDPVSLSTEAKVIEHFVELLGDSNTMVFTITKAPSGLPYIFYDDIY